METMLFYFGKVMLTSGTLFLYYYLFLKDGTFHRYNRFYLLAATLVSLFLPLLKADDFTIEVNNDIYLLINQLHWKGTETAGRHSYYLIIFTISFIMIAVFLTGRLVLGIFRIRQFKSLFPKEVFNGINFYHTDLDKAPFSYFRDLFWKNSIPLHSDFGQQILKHEMVHIEQKHTYDKIFIEIIKSVFWFNPFFYLIRKEMELLHEYLADEKAVSQCDTKAFAQMLLASHFSGNALSATSAFASSDIKKRLRMIKAPKTKFSYMRRIVALPLLFTITFVYVVNAKNRELRSANTEIIQIASAMKEDVVVNMPGTGSYLEKRADLSGLPRALESSVPVGEETETVPQTTGTLQLLFTRLQLLSEKNRYTAIPAAHLAVILNGDKAPSDLQIFHNGPERDEAVVVTQDIELARTIAARAKKVDTEAEIAATEALLASEEAALASQEAKLAREEADMYRRLRK